MRYLILLFLYVTSAFGNCAGFVKAERFLDTNKFLEASNNHRMRNEERRRLGQDPEPEEAFKIGDIQQARNYAFNFPAIRDLGFPPPTANTWTPHVKRALGGSRAAGMRDGWKISHNGRYAVIRLDFDPQKGMHYNIELEDAQRRTHKLAVEFECGNRPCNERDYLRAMQTLNR